MKKKLSLILIAAVLLGTASCGEGGGTKVFGDAFSFGTEKTSHRNSHRHSKKQTKKFGKKSKKQKRAGKRKQPKQKRVVKKTVVKKTSPKDSRMQTTSTTSVTGKSASLTGRWYRTKTTINGKVDKDNPFRGMVYNFRGDGVLEISYHGSAKGVTVNRPRSNYSVKGNVITVPGSGSFTIKKLTDKELVLSSRGGGEMVQYYVRQ